LRDTLSATTTTQHNATTPSQPPPTNNDDADGLSEDDYDYSDLPPPVDDNACDLDEFLEDDYDDADLGDIHDLMETLKKAAQDAPETRHHADGGEAPQPDHPSGMHAVHPDGGGIRSELTLQPFGVPGALAVPADEAWPAETPDDEINVLEMIQRHEDVLSLLPKVTLLKIALDSGACEHVVSKSDLQGFKIEESEASRRGEHYIAADGGKVPNQGQCRVGLRAQGTGVEFDSLFQLAPVSRPLYSVGKICDGGAEVKFTAKEATVVKNGRVIATFARQNGLYVAQIEVKGEADPASVFIGQGANR